MARALQFDGGPRLPALVAFEANGGGIAHGAAEGIRYPSSRVLVAFGQGALAWWWRSRFRDGAARDALGGALESSGSARGGSWGAHPGPGRGPVVHASGWI